MVAVRHTIDGFAFAATRGTRSGSVAAAESSTALPRLAESGARDVRVDYTVEGVESARGKPALRIAARGEATLACQRCLEPVTQPFAVEAELELAPDLATAEGADDEIDRVLAGPAMDVLQLVEDELLLEMPMVPRHEACVSVAREGRAAPALSDALARWSAKKDRKEH